MPQTQYRKPYTRAQGARKPQTPQQQLQRAIERLAESRKEGADLRVIAIGKVLATGQPVYFVPSQTVVGMWHAIVQTETGLACDCFYSKERHMVCVHRACVYEHLKSHPAQQHEKPAPAQPVENKNTPPAQPQDPQQPLKVSQPTSTPEGVLVAATAPNIAISADDAWERYQDARRNGDFYA